ncbi:hypothetical protein ACOMHN_010396 [Nucella lapillus]
MAAQNQTSISSFQLNYTYPRHERDAGLLFNLLYYGVAIPVSYVGNLFTYIIVCKLLRYRDSTSDVLVGGLALNDVLTATIVFTPSLISAARGRYFGSQMVCEFSAVTTGWYIYTTFAMLVLISAERWLAITKPFRYKRLLVTGFKLKFIMGVLGFFCLMLASLPLLRWVMCLCGVVWRGVVWCGVAWCGVVTAGFKLKFIMAVLGFFCLMLASLPLLSWLQGQVHHGSPWLLLSYVGVSASVEVRETMYIKLVYLVAGIFMLVGCNISVAYTLKSRSFGGAASREVDRKFARIMGVVAALFLFTWLPNLTAQAACLAKSPVCPTFEFWAMRIVNIGVAVNPFVYGVMKTTYRRGYLYLVRVCLHYLTCTLLPLPTYGEEIFDLRERPPRSRSNSNTSASSHNHKRLSTRASTHTVSNGGQSPNT